MNDHDYFAVVCQYPSTTGLIHDLKAYVEQAHASQAAFIVCADLLALTLLVPPGEFGADIVAGSTQRFGMPMGAGGPHAAYGLPRRVQALATGPLGRRQQGRRKAPRLPPGAADARAAHPPREGHQQHLHGPGAAGRGGQHVRRLSRAPGPDAHRRARGQLCRHPSDGLQRQGLKVVTPAAFDTITVECDAAAVLARALAGGANLRKLSDTHVAVALDETTTRADIEALWAGLRPATRAQVRGLRGRHRVAHPAGPASHQPFLTHPVFNTHHSETEMLRYLRSLADKDLALDRSMIPLGSCTMKLNATAEMIPITWPEFANLHPFAPHDQLAGYHALNAQLCQWLSECTGYAGISLQPNAGSQGEYAGLLAIKAWHESRGEARATSA